jgi:hypothetical protein
MATELSKPTNHFVSVAHGMYQDLLGLSIRYLLVNVLGLPHAIF